MNFQGRNAFLSLCSVKLIFQFSVHAARQPCSQTLGKKNRCLRVGYVGISIYSYFAITFAYLLLELNYAPLPSSPVMLTYICINITSGTFSKQQIQDLIFTIAQSAVFIHSPFGQADWFLKSCCHMYRINPGVLQKKSGLPRFPLQSQRRGNQHMDDLCKAGKGFPECSPHQETYSRQRKPQLT